jgi:hypothetical protein
VSVLGHYGAEGDFNLFTPTLIWEPSGAIAAMKNDIEIPIPGRFKRPFVKELYKTVE